MKEWTSELDGVHIRWERVVALNERAEKKIQTEGEENKEEEEEEKEGT